MSNGNLDPGGVASGFTPAQLAQLTQLIQGATANPNQTAPPHQAAPSGFFSSLPSEALDSLPVQDVVKMAMESEREAIVQAVIAHVEQSYAPIINQMVDRQEITEREVGWLGLVGEVGMESAQEKVEGMAQALQSNKALSVRDAYRLSGGVFPEAEKAEKESGEGEKGEKEGEEEVEGEEGSVSEPSVESEKEEVDLEGKPKSKADQMAEAGASPAEIAAEELGLSDDELIQAAEEEMLSGAA